MFPGQPPSFRPTLPEGRVLALLAALAVAAGMQGGCVDMLSLQPLAGPADTVIDAAYRGTWDTPPDSESGNELGRVVFDGARSRMLVLHGDTLVEEYSLRPVKLGRRWFVDRQLVRSEEWLSGLSAAGRDSLLNMHWFGRARISDSLLWFDFADVTELQAFEIRNAWGLRFATDPDGEDYLDTDPRLLRRFLEYHGGDDRLFSYEIGPFRRVRPRRLRARNRGRRLAPRAVRARALPAEVPCRSRPGSKSISTSSIPISKR